jgi:hypothetical protein
MYGTKFFPAHSYQYTFQPNPNWSSLYAPAREIQSYLQDVAEKYSATRFIRLRHEIKACHWNDRTAKWSITVQNLTTGETLHDQADVLISGRGNLNTPSWPDIDGLETFKGEKMHSATWNQRYGNLHSIHVREARLTFAQLRLRRQAYRRHRLRLFLHSDSTLASTPARNTRQHIRTKQDVDLAAVWPATLG